MTAVSEFGTEADGLLSPKERYMNNVRQLFPNATNEEYEDLMLPVVIEQIEVLWDLAEKGNNEPAWEISISLLEYVYTSLETLDDIRRSGYFDDNKLPEPLAHAVDNLIADCAKVMGGSESLVDQIRTRSSPKRTKQLGKEWLN